MTSSPSQNVSLQVCSPGQWADVRCDWAALADASAYTSFFLLPEWTECWLENCAAGLKARVLVFRDGSRPVGACLVASKTVRRAGIPLCRLYLNAAGEDDRDDTCIEFNNLLCLPGWEGAVAN